MIDFSITALLTIVINNNIYVKEVESIRDAVTFAQVCGKPVTIIRMYSLFICVCIFPPRAIVYRQF